MSNNAVSKGKAYANAIPEVFSKKLTLALHKSGKMMQCVNTDHQSDVDSGDIINIRALDTVNVKTYTGTLTYAAQTPTNQQLIIDQEKEFTFLIPDISKKQSDIELEGNYFQEAKIQVGLTKDTFLLGKYTDVAAGNQVNHASQAITLDKDTIYSYFVELAQKLKDSGAFYRSKKTPWVVINPTIEAKLIQAPEFIHATQLGDKVLREGSIGQIAGLEVLVSNNFVAIDDVYPVLAGINEAITFVSQIAKTETLRDKDTFADFCRGLYVYGAKTELPTGLSVAYFATA